MAAVRQHRDQRLTYVEAPAIGAFSGERWHDRCAAEWHTESGHGRRARPACVVGIVDGCDSTPARAGASADWLSL
mgnify:CR=1 FL=1